MTPAASRSYDALAFASHADDRQAAGILGVARCEMNSKASIDGFIAQPALALVGLSRRPDSFRPAAIAPCYSLF